MTLADGVDAAYDIVPIRERLVQTSFLVPGLAVTLDDAADGITVVTRGADLFLASHLHRLLQALLGLPTPLYHHHALLVGPDGQRLAKRNDAPTLESVRLRGKDGRALAARLRAGGAGIGIAEQSA